jgi:endonuclease YncB( thermonuclease family)
MWTLGSTLGCASVKVRLYGIDAPEMRGTERPDGLVSRDWLRGEILGRDIVMRTYRDGTATGKYGRWLAEIYRAEGDAVSINQELVTNGLAVTASY